MKLSARNQLKGKVTRVEKGATTAHVAVELAGGHTVTASITNEAVDDLGLVIGDDAWVMIKASDVMMRRSDRMRLWVVSLLCVLAAPALAQTPRGCDKFEWALDAEKQALATASKVAEGTELQRTSIEAVAVPLKPLAEAGLAMPPERTPKQGDAFAGAISFSAGKAGRFRVTLPEAGYVDAVQEGRYLTSTAHTGALDCPGLRKSVEFEIGPEPFIIQLSDVATPVISVVLTPSD